jgi:predicted ABC-type ATPase
VLARREKDIKHRFLDATGSRTGCYTGSMPNVVILAGPNGAGKSTVAPAVVRDLFMVEAFVNVEEIARGLAGFNPESAMPRAEEIKMQVLQNFARKRVDFGFETTLTGIDFAPFVRELKDAGYRLHLIYVGLESADLSVRRVRSRARAGGQAVDEAIVRRRYEDGIRNLFTVYQPLADTWSVYDNSGATELRLIAEGHGSETNVIHEQQTWDEMRRRAGT